MFSPQDFVQPDAERWLKKSSTQVLNEAVELPLTDDKDFKHLQLQM